MIIAFATLIVILLLDARQQVYVHIPSEIRELDRRINDVNMRIDDVNKRIDTLQDTMGLFLPQTAVKDKKRAKTPLSKPLI